MSSTTLLLMFAAACSSLLLVSSKIVTAEREALIESAITEVNDEFSNLEEVKLSASRAKLRAYSRDTKEGIAQGLASLKFERMVKVAEKKILRNRRLASVQTTSSMAEALATELLHKPGSILSAQEIARIYEESECEEILPTPNCDSPQVMYHRTPDGSCNNLANPTLGAAGTPLRRLIPARYDDGVSRPRGFLQSQGSVLFNGPFSSPTPSPRVARTSIVEDRPLNDAVHTHMLMQWGQFMDHDMDIVAEFPECPEGCEITDENEGRCYPFAVPADDEDVLVTRTDPESRGCHEFRRSLGACPLPGATKLPLREQVNVITHLIDGSNVYGHSQAIFDDLRDSSSSDGLLRTGPPANVGSQRPLLPDAGDNSQVICPPFAVPCFVAGDIRVIEQSALTVMHTIWVREHNRIAPVIRQLNPGFTSDLVFLTTRQIVASIIQKITFQDFIPILIGDLTDTLIPPYSGYDDTVDPSIPNAFATAAYRYGHSQIQPFFERLDASYESIPAGPLPLVDAFFDTNPVREFGTDPLVRGLLGKPARQVDEFLNSILTNQLFAADATSPGIDLASINIQRGRDHGLPPYLVWKQWAEERCGVESEFTHELTEIHLLQTYGSLESVDLFVGGLSEEPLPGGLVGAVFGCIFAHTFKNLRDGDRFYYENDDPETAPLTEPQRQQINMATLSRVLCDNTDITEIQPNAFFNQPRVPCDGLPEVDLSVFPDTPPTTPPTTPPVLGQEICYIRVVGAGITVISTVVPNVLNLPVVVDINNDATDPCHMVRCPQGVGQTLISVGSTCPPVPSPVVNVLLPSSVSTTSYQGALSVADFDNSIPNGIYTDLATCMNMANPDAVVFGCTSSQHAGDFVHVETNSIDLIRELAGDAIVEEMFGHSTAAAASDENKLVGLMEEMLEEMKASSHKESAKQQAKEMKTAGEESDSSLVSELEKVLQELE